MKKIFAGVVTLLFLISNLFGCQAVGEKNASHTYIYGATAIISFLLLIACCGLVRKNMPWFILLFSSVLVVNTGYTFLALSTSLEMALWANRVAYLGSVFLPFSMLMIILNVTNTPHKKWIHGALGVLSIIIFLIAASPGILPIYYKEVSYAVVNGVATLIKDYGPLHPIYLFYLVGYFLSMVIVIIFARINKTIDTPTHAIMIAIAVLVNIGVWLIEQLTAIDFEILSVSYIISEMFLLGVYLTMNENQKLRNIVKQIETARDYPENQTAPTDIMLENPLEDKNIDPARIETFMAGLGSLTPTEKKVYEAYIARVTTKEIMANLNIKENTLKYHNRNLYSKLGVSSRKELLEIHKHLKHMKDKFETANNADN